MTNRPKAIGTRGETAVTRYAREHGFPLADRRPLKGTLDEGDVLLTVGLIAEVKSGKSAQNASLGQIRKWLAETERERVNAGAEHAILVVQRRGPRRGARRGVGVLAGVRILRPRQRGRRPTADHLHDPRRWAHAPAHG